MKCSACQAEIRADGLVVTFVSSAKTYTAALHMDCVRALVGDANMRKLRNTAFASGRTQDGSPGFAN